MGPRRSRKVPDRPDLNRAIVPLQPDFDAVYSAGASPPSPILRDLWAAAMSYAAKD